MKKVLALAACLFAAYIVLPFGFGLWNDSIGFYGHITIIDPEDASATESGDVLAKAASISAETTESSSPEPSAVSDAASSESPSDNQPDSSAEPSSETSQQYQADNSTAPSEQITASGSAPSTSLAEAPASPDTTPVLTESADGSVFESAAQPSADTESTEMSLDTAPAPGPDGPA